MWTNVEIYTAFFLQTLGMGDNAYYANKLGKAIATLCRNAGMGTENGNE
jgi:hypothetical protein